MSLESDAAIFIKKFESYSSKPYWDVNAYRLGHGSDTITFPDGTYRKVQKTDVTTREMAQKDLERRLSKEFIPKVKSQVGEPSWSNLPDPAKVSLISLAYNYGSITKQAIIDAARSGNVEKLSKSIVDSTYNDNKKLSEKVRNALRERRAHEAEHAKSTWEKVKDKVVDVAKEAAKTQDEMNRYVKRNWMPILLIGVGVAGLIYVGYKYQTSKSLQTT